MSGTIRGSVRLVLRATKNFRCIRPSSLLPWPADAIRDCSRRGDTVLDVFGGSESTLIAAEQCGRYARLIELDPLYCDTIIRRFQRVTGEQVILAETGKRFSEVDKQRRCEPAEPSQLGADELCTPASMYEGSL
ncbi:DNA methyltransferase [Ochrobactrum sp. AN78]|uniref:DNA methyltransferase n=1 Tax=Ochrobactrum sp. AN78 TaxID=3039853 RepID=UPI00298A036F|nr:DNA methyltransferase [Ochrobactrum sp. AN78]